MINGFKVVKVREVSFTAKDGSAVHYFETLLEDSKGNWATRKLQCAVAVGDVVIADAYIFNQEVRFRLVKYEASK